MRDARHVVLFTLGLLFAGWLVHRTWPVLRPFVLALLLGIMLEPPVRWLERRRLPRAVGVPLLLLGCVGGVVLVCVLVLPPLVEQFNQLLQDLPRTLQVLRHRLDLALQRYPHLERTWETMLEESVGYLSGMVPLVGRALGATGSVLLEGVVALFALLFGLLNPGPLVEAFFEAFPPARREEARRICARLVVQVRVWLQGVLLGMLSIGLLALVGLLLLGVRYAAAFAALSGLLEVVPYIGPVVSAVLPAFIAWTQEPTKALYVLAMYAGIQQFESHLLIPLIMSRQMRLHPVGVMLFMLVMTMLLGIFGALVALPTYACARVLYQELYLRRSDGQGR